MRTAFSVLDDAPSTDDGDDRCDRERPRAAGGPAVQEHEHSGPAQPRHDHERQCVARQTVVDVAGVVVHRHHPGHRRDPGGDGRADRPLGEVGLQIGRGTGSPGVR